MVDGYTTDKHATQVETFADTTQTLLFPLDEGVTIEEAQDEVIFYANKTSVGCKWTVLSESTMVNYSSDIT